TPHPGAGPFLDENLGAGGADVAGEPLDATAPGRNRHQPRDALTLAAALLLIGVEGLALCVPQRGPNRKNRARAGLPNLAGMVGIAGAPTGCVRLLSATPSA